MQQLTKEQAIDISNSGVWKDWSDEQVVRFQLFQDRLAMPFSRFHDAICNVLGREVYTHELALDRHGIMAEYLGCRAAPTIEEILGLLPKGKILIVET